MFIHNGSNRLPLDSSEQTIFVSWEYVRRLESTDPVTQKAVLQPSVALSLVTVLTLTLPDR